MRQTKLPNVPNPDDAQYKGNPLAYQRALFNWATIIKGKLEQDSLSNDTPMDQAFTLGSYVLTTAISGTSTGTDIANFIVTLCNSMVKKGTMKTINVLHE